MLYFYIFKIYLTFDCHFSSLIPTLSICNDTYKILFDSFVLFFFPLLIFALSVLACTQGGYRLISEHIFMWEFLWCFTPHCFFFTDLLSSVTSAFAIYLGFSSLSLKINCSGQGLSCQTHSFQALWCSSRPVRILLQLTRVVGVFLLKLGKQTAVWFPWLSQVEVICKDLMLLSTLISPWKHLLYAS